jgi:hypothetical protein
MNRKQHSGVFLMEMTAVVFFFILCSAFCIKTFVKADWLSQKATDLNQGVLIAQSIAEVWKAEGSEGLEKQFKAVRGEENANIYRMQFDNSGNSCKEQEGVFFVDVQITLKGQLAIVITRRNHEVYRLNIHRHETDE